jgi:hypothetical protein
VGDPASGPCCGPSRQQRPTATSPPGVAVAPQGRGATAAMVFSADDTCDVGMEGGAVVSEDYGPRGNEFTGEVNWVQIDLAEAAEDLDHLITPEERLHIAMARQ